MSAILTPWSQGTTPPLLQTRHWSPEQIAAAADREQCKVYACGHLVAICERKDYARLITLTPVLLTNLQNCAAQLATVRGRSDPFARAAFALIARATRSEA